MAPTNTHNQVLAFCFGALIMALSFSSFRAPGSVGILEIGLLFVIGVYVFINFILKPGKIYYLTLLPIFFLLVFVFPITIFNYFFDFYGTHLPTLFALFFAFLVGTTVFHFSEAEVKSLTYGLAIISICSMLYIILSGELIGTITRVLFLSSNPNQLALYGLAGAFIIAKNIENQRIAIPSIIVTLLYGLISLSDSLFLAMVVSTLFYFLIISLERDLFIQIFVPLTILLLIIFININIDLGEFIRALIREADEGGTRFDLFNYGFDAYLSSPILGHGAGSFAGKFYPFGRFEAHNTVIDLLTIGGPILVAILYLPIFGGIYIYLKNRRYLAATILLGLIVFSFFHFTARHPIVWVVWGITLRDIYFKYQNVWNLRPNF